MGQVASRARLSIVLDRLNVLPTFFYIYRPEYRDKFVRMISTVCQELPKKFPYSVFQP